MAEDSDKSEKTEPPSPFKLREAQKKGQVYKSQEVNSVAALFLIFVLLAVSGAAFMSDVFLLCASIFKSSGQLVFSRGVLAPFFMDIVSRVAYIVSPIVIVMMLGGVLVTVIQTGLVFSTFPMKPDLKKLNPVSGFKKLFSMKTLFELLKTTIKVVSFSLILFFLMNSLVPEVLSLSQRNIRVLIPFFVSHAQLIIFQLLCAIVLIAVLDFLFVRWEYLKNMRMTKKEVKDEYKRREGDPKIKQKRKEIQRELLKKAQSMSLVARGDMVITNPVHYAVVLKYDPKSMFSPKVITKGRGFRAQKIKDEARKHGIPIYENPALARQLYRDCDIDRGIPLFSYFPVAKLYRRLYQSNPMATFGAGI